MRLQRKGDFVRCVEKNQLQKYHLTSGANCLIRIAAPAKERGQGAQVDEVRAVLVRSPSKSTSHAVRELNMSHATQHKILSKSFKLQHTTTQDKGVHNEL